jgi:alpha-1,6-mannosyltransferase
MPIKTLHITNYYHASSGGIRTFYRALLHAADAQRREVRLVVPGPEDSVENIGDFGRIYTIAAPRSRLFDSSYRLLLPHLYALPYSSQLRRILQEEQPDLVEICDKYTLCFLPSMLRRRWIEGVTPAALVGLSCERMDDNISAFISSGPLGRFFSSWYMRTMYAPRFDCHISVSDYTAQELWQALVDRPDLPVHVCPMGVSSDHLSPSRRSQRTRAALLDLLRASDPVHPVDDQTRLLLYVGRISPEKNLSLLVDMMRTLACEPSRDCRLLIAGAGPLEPWLAETAERSMPGRVYRLGHVSDRDRLADIYANCDALIHPNPREPFGIVPLEAMASGLPVVAPNSGGVLAYAHAGNAWLAEPTGKAFAAAVLDLLSEDGTKESRIAQALHTASELSWPRVTARFFTLYDDLYQRFRAKNLPPVVVGSTESVQFVG